MYKAILTTLLILHLSITINSQDIQSSATGFSIYGGLSYSSWTSESFFLGELAETEPTGYGYKLGVGYGINERISIHANHYGLYFNQEFDWNSFSINMQTLSARFTFGATLSKWRPTFEAGMALVSNKVDPVAFDGYDDWELRNKGLGLHLGGGISYHINTALSICLQGNYMYGNFSSITFSGTEYDPEEDVDFGILNINLGVRYYID